MNKRIWLCSIQLILILALAACVKSSPHSSAGASVSSTTNLTSLFSSPGIPGAQYAIPDDMGAAYWAGQYSGSTAGNNLPDALAELAQKGFQTYKVPLDVNDAVNYFGINVAGATEESYLSQLASTPVVVQAFRTPGIKNIVLSTFDSVVLGLDGSQRNFANASFLAANQTQIVDSYRDLALVLFRNYKNTGKRFYIDGWELDNSMYCGSAFCYTHNQPADCAGPVTNPQNYANFKDYCDQNYQSFYGAANSDEGYANVLVWFQDRQQGIQEAEQIAAGEGDTGVTVVDAVEFNSIHMLHDFTDDSHPNGYPEALYQVIPVLHPGAATYSSYESVNSGALLTDFPTIQAQAGNSEIDISEYGFVEGTNYTVNGTSYTGDQMMTNTTEQILSLHAQGELGFGIVWQSFNDSGDMGLLNGDGTNLPMFTSLMSATQASTSSSSSGTGSGSGSNSFPAPAINQNGIGYDGIGYDGNAYISIYGQNLGTSIDPATNASLNNVVVSMLCPNSGVFIYPNVTYNNATQINAGFTPFPQTDPSCQVTVSVTSNGLTETSGAQSVTVYAGTSMTSNPTPTPTPPMTPTPTPMPTAKPLSNPTITTSTPDGTAIGSVSYVTLKGQYWSAASDYEGFNVTSNNCTIVPNQTYSYSGPDGAYPNDPTKTQVNVAINNSDQDAPISCNFTVTRDSDGAMVSTTVVNIAMAMPTVTADYSDGALGNVTYVTLLGQYWSNNPGNPGGFAVTSTGCNIVPNQTYSYNGVDGADPNDPSFRQVNLAIDNTTFSAPFSCTFTITRQDGLAVSSTLTGIPNN